MKILYHHRIGSRDGQSVHLEELIAALRRQGAKVVLAGPANFAAGTFGDDPKFIGALKRHIPKSVYALLEIAYNLVAYRRLRRALLGFKPDIIYERYNLNLMAGILLKRRHGVPLMLEVNAPLAQERAEFGGLGLRGLMARIEAWTWRNADLVLPVTEVLAQQLRSCSVEPERIHVIANGIDPAKFLSGHDTEKAKQELGLSGKLIIGFTGFMRPWHGLDAILDWMAAEAPADLHAVIAGDGPARPLLEAQAVRLGIADRVTFPGLVDRDAIGRLVAAFDIALQPRSVAYASPLKLFEYMALGKAVLAPDQPNIREVLTPELDAVLFDPERPQSMAAALARLVSDAGLRQRLGQEARQTIIRRRLTWDDNAARVIELAQSCIKSSVQRASPVAERP